MATAAGRASLAGGREALISLRAARQELQDVIDPDRGRVALGFLHSRGLRDVPALLDAFLAAYPEVSFTLRQGPAADLIDQMRSGLLDVVIVAPLPTQDDQLESVVLDDEPLYLTVASDHRLAKRRSVELRQAAGEYFIALTPGHGLRQTFDQMCRQAGFEPALAFEGACAHPDRPRRTCSRVWRRPRPSPPPRRAVVRTTGRPRRFRASRPPRTGGSQRRRQPPGQ